MTTTEIKVGDRFYHQGSWNTEPGWWEVTVPDAGCGMTKAKPIDNKYEGESEWHSPYVKDTLSERQPSEG